MRGPSHTGGGPLPAVLAMVLMAAVVSASTAFLIRPAVSVQEMAIDRVVEQVSPRTGPASGPPTGLHLYLVPHPDDELGAWTSLAEAEAMWPVMVVLTRGEETSRCAGPDLSGLQESLGEVAPVPAPVTGRGSEECRKARVGSMRRVLVEAENGTPIVEGLGTGQLSGLIVAGEPVEIVTGMHATLVLLDLGDGALSVEAVRRVVEEIPTMASVPDLPVGRVTASAYYADAMEAPTPPACDRPVLCPSDGRPYDYRHRDHEVAREAARLLAGEADQGAWLLTSPYDPAANRFLALDPEVYHEFMGLDGRDPKQARRLGSYQRYYGWLAFPDAWRPGDLPLDADQVLFPRVQSFEVVAP